MKLHSFEEYEYSDEREQQRQEEALRAHYEREQPKITWKELLWFFLEVLVVATLFGVVMWIRAIPR